MHPSTRRLRRGLLDLAEVMYRERVALGDTRLLPLGVGVAPAEQPIPSAEVDGWRAWGVGARWGDIDETVWFHATAEAPAGWIAQLDAPDAEMAVVLRLLLGRGLEDGFGWPEGLLYVNGRLQQGINRHHPDVLLRNEDVRRGALAFDVRAWSGLFAQDHRIEYAEIALLDRRCEALYHLLAAGVDLLDTLPEDQPLTYALAQALDEAYDAIDLHAPAVTSLAASAHVALARLTERLAELRAHYDTPERPVVTAIGHAHLDVAWLWQTRHTREKTARTFGVALALMDAYPDYYFLHTTPQVYEWLHHDYPELYERVRERVAEGRFEAAGAMWLEADCNLPAGESLVRQILYGQRFLREAFGQECDVLWLPDAFGYSAALPQIILRSGLRTFMTTKMSWSETNRIPMDTFRWRGLDGSEVLAHFITTPSEWPGALPRMDTYNGVLDVTSVLGIWQRYRQKAVNSELLLSYGFGDGGAGPVRQYLDAARAMQQLPGMPALRLGRADEYFARLHARLDQSLDLPTWDGELYLEFHRGTYTSHARIKRLHRQCETKLLLAELLDAWRWSRAPETAPDARSTLDEAWRTLLLHEFHDILPGSSIGAVYQDAREALGGLSETLGSFIDEALLAVASRRVGEAQSLVAFNPSPWPRAALLEVALSEGDVKAEALQVVDASGVALPVQVTESEGEKTLLVDVPALPAHGFQMLGMRASLANKKAASAPHERVSVEALVKHTHQLENGILRLVVNGDGEIISCVDLRVPGGRELVAAAAAANVFEAFDDRPPSFDAWDIDATYERKRYPLGAARVELIERGPLRATLRVTRTILLSTVEQRISLCRGSAQVDFATRIDWHDHHVLLKVAFPLDLRVTHATSEIQYGAIERPTHRNTSWDQARFEELAHRWIDLSEGDYGVSLLNDGRYGHDVLGSTLRLSLLRSPTNPDPETDQGEQHVTYSLYPHVGDWRTGETVAAAYALNRPVLVRRVGEIGAMDEAERGDEPAVMMFFTAEPGCAVIETVKRGMDGDGLIVRVYEAHGSRCAARVRAPLALERVIECDLLERPLRAGESPAFAAWQASAVASHDAPVTDEQGWSFTLRPFEVRTFRVWLNNFI